MQIRNCLIVMCDDSLIHLSPAEMRDFSGNIIYSQGHLPASLRMALHNHTGFADCEPMQSDTCIAPRQAKE